MITEPVGLYIHIPYCVRKCNYCDFCSLGTASGVPDEYISRLLDEAGRYRDKHLSADTVFIGGGTPSLMTGGQMERLVSGLREIIPITDNAEFTLECNPGTARAEFFSVCRTLGVNRISFGLQSIHENELKMLGRIHSYSDFLTAYGEARAAGFDNISVDLMYGIPCQTRESFAETLAAVTALSVEHISAYGLIIEEGTRFYRERDSLPLPDEDAECDMYYIADEYLTSCGFSHYEVSNYARSGWESRHNLKYWQLRDYVGLGASAHSLLGGKRYYNTSLVADYLSGAQDSQTLPEECDEKSEYVMLALRLSSGMSLSEYSRRFGEDFLTLHRDTVNKYLAAGLMTEGDDRIALTARGLYLSNLVISELI